MTLSQLTMIPVILTVTLVCHLVNVVRGEGYQQLRQPDGSYQMDNVKNDDKYWTGWINGCPRQDTGDFEARYDFQNPSRGYDVVGKTCKLWCQNPLAVKWRLSSSNSLADPPAEVEKCVVLDPAKFGTTLFMGFECLNYKQMESTCSKEFCARNNMLSSAMAPYKRVMTEIKCDRCPDFEVNYLCPPDQPKPADTNKPCPWASQRSLRELQYELQDSENKVEAMKKELGEVESAEFNKRTITSESNDDKAELRNLLKLLLQEKDLKE